MSRPPGAGYLPGSHKVWRTPGDSGALVGDGNGISGSHFSDPQNPHREKRLFPETPLPLPALSIVISEAGKQPKMLIQPDALPLDGSNLPGRLIASLHGFCLWFSLPLAIWLSSGWIGLILHWQADLGAARPWSGSWLKAGRWRTL